LTRWGRRQAGLVEPQHFSGVNMLLWSIAQHLPVSWPARPPSAGLATPRRTSWERLVTDFLAKLQFRHDMLAALEIRCNAAAIASHSA
jgi:hypothetical protein